MVQRQARSMSRVTGHIALKICVACGLHLECSAVPSSSLLWCPFNWDVSFELMDKKIHQNRRRIVNILGKPGSHRGVNFMNIQNMQYSTIEKLPSIHSCQQAFYGLMDTKLGIPSCQTWPNSHQKGKQWKSCTSSSTIPVPLSTVHRSLGMFLGFQWWIEGHMQCQFLHWLFCICKNTLL